MSNEWYQDIYEDAVEETEKHLAKLYRRTAIRLKRDIEDLYNKFEVRPEDLIINDLYKNNQYYKLLSQLNQELTHLGAEEIKIMDRHMLDFYDHTSRMVSNSIGFQQVFELPAERVIHSIWCKDGKD